MKSYFRRHKRKLDLLKKLNSFRVKRASFAFPLGIVPDSAYLPDEGYTVEYEESSHESPFGDRIVYCLSISIEKVSPVFWDCLKLFGANASIIIERWSEDVNREKDIFVSPDIEISKIEELFCEYEELWTECGFVSFGIIDYNSGYEVFLSDHKTINLFMPIDEQEKAEKILKRHNIAFDKDVLFSFNFEHWHYSLVGLISEISDSEEDEYDFDYYDIINELKQPLSLELVTSEEEEIKVAPRWWYVVVRGRAKDNRDFVISYYIVAETEEEMETLVEEDLNVSSSDYYIFDKCNVNPDAVSCEHKETQGFSKASAGIWLKSKAVFVNELKISETES